MGSYVIFYVQAIQSVTQEDFSVQSREATYHLSLSFAPAENDDDLSTSPISSLQKLKLLIVHMYENLTTFTWKCNQQQ